VQLIITLTLGHLTTIYNNQDKNIPNKMMHELKENSSKGNFCNLTELDSNSISTEIKDIQGVEESHHPS